MDKVKTNSLDLVFDKSGMSLNGVPLLMYARDNFDFTNDVVAVLNKPGRATTSTEKPATLPEKPSTLPAITGSPSPKATTKP
jgi:hypothetical protein